MQKLKLLLLVLASAAIMSGLNYWAGRPKEKPLPRRAPAWADTDTTKPLNCLVANDFYVAHLTSYIQTEPSAADPKRAEAFRPYCRSIPAAGRLVFSFDLVDREARKVPVALAVLKYGADGSKTVIKEQPAAAYPAGVAAITADIPEAGRYGLKLAFGEGRSADEVIETPIAVGLTESQ